MDNKKDILVVGSTFADALDFALSIAPQYFVQQVKVYYIDCLNATIYFHEAGRAITASRWDTIWISDNISKDYVDEIYRPMLRPDGDEDVRFFNINFLTEDITEKVEDE